MNITSENPYTIVQSIIDKFSEISLTAFENAAGLCISLGNLEITPEHLLLELLKNQVSDITATLALPSINYHNELYDMCFEHVQSLTKSPSAKPRFSQKLADLLIDCFHTAKQWKMETIRSGVILFLIIHQGRKYLSIKPIFPCSSEVPKGLLEKAQGKEGNLAFDREKTKKPSALSKFTRDITALARSQNLDPVLCRDNEIRQLIDVVVRRKKNNPLIVGEAGVGKTSLVDGFAQRIVLKQVPAELEKVSVLALNLSAIQAGAGIKGEIEQRFTDLFNEIKAAKNVILFIDEIHTVLAQQNSDIVSILKPELSSGAIKLIGATTFSEYKKFFEKDDAFSRRFQTINVEEPSIEDAIRMIRATSTKLEESHRVIIRNEAIVAAVKLSARYITNRQLPDKAIDLIDTASARVKILRSTNPIASESLHSELDHMDRYIAALVHDQNCGITINQEEFNILNEKKKVIEDQIKSISSQYTKQKELANGIQELREKTTSVKDLSSDDNKIKLAERLVELSQIPAEKQLVYADVDANIIASIVSDFTGIPVGSMMKDEIKTILGIEDTLKQRVKGQDHALSLIAKELQNAKTHLKSETTPLGVFLLVGPSGVGKTETALALADNLFGGERFVITINMSEFQEKHTVSRLIGSPPGYVGYGEGGVLTEGIRKRPYSVVLLDEIEKADPEVMNLFYQVFDKGILGDGNGRMIDCKNTVILMTSNLGSNIIMDNKDKSSDEILPLVLPVLNNVFKPALVGRMTVIPYLPLSKDHLREIVLLKTAAMSKRCKEGNNLELVFSSNVIGHIVDQCTDAEFGARNIDHILRKQVMPVLSSSILRSMAEGNVSEKIEMIYEEGGYKVI